MQRFQKFEVDSYTYSNLRKVQIKNGTQIKEQYIGSRKKLFSQNYLIATTANNAQLELNGLSHQKFNSFLGLFSKNLYSQFHKNEKLFDLIAKKQYQKDKQKVITRVRLYQKRIQDIEQLERLNELKEQGLISYKLNAHEQQELLENLEILGL